MLTSADDLYNQVSFYAAERLFSSQFLSASSQDIFIYAKRIRTKRIIEKIGMSLYQR